MGALLIIWAGKPLLAWDGLVLPYPQGKKTAWGSGAVERRQKMACEAEHANVATRIVELACAQDLLDEAISAGADQTMSTIMSMRGTSYSSGLGDSCLDSH